MANGRVGLMVLHFEMCLFKEGNCMVIFSAKLNWLLGWQDYNREIKGKILENCANPKYDNNKNSFPSSCGG